MGEALPRAMTSKTTKQAGARHKQDYAKSCLVKADCVCFDVDSTVIISEGIDDLATYLGVGNQVAALTASAMGGAMPFHEALEARLKLMPHTKSQLTEMLATEAVEDKLSPGVAALVALLQRRGCAVYLVSGGFRQMIEPIAAALGVPNQNIYSNTLVYNADGEFTNHDEAEPTSRADGKAKVVADLRAEHGYKTVVMIGDGATDMEARDAEGGADAFIGYGGVRVREKVQQGADWFVLDLNDLLKALKPPPAPSPAGPEEVRHFSLFQ